MKNADMLLEDALALHRAGHFADAEAAYRDLLAAEPEHPEAMYFLGLCRHQLGFHDEAVKLIITALKARPRDPQMLFNLGLVQTAAGQCDSAAETFRTLISAGASDPNIVNALAVALKGAGRLAEAESVLTALTQSDPGFAGGHFNLGNVLLTLGRPTAAVAAFERAQDLGLSDIGVLLNLGAALQSIGDTVRAKRTLEQAQRLAPDNPALLNNLGMLSRQTGDRDTARRLLQRAVALDPTQADAAYNLGTVLADINDTRAATHAFAQAYAARPGLLKADWAQALVLPQIYPSEDARADARTRYLAGVERITADHVAEADLAAAFAAASEITPFALAYQGGDDLAVMTRWGDHIADIAARTHPDIAAPPTSKPSQRKRIVFVSAHFREHTIERLFGRWLGALDRDRFEVHLVSTNGAGDSRTRDLVRKADGHITAAMGTAELARAIHGLAADVVVYPDIGMDPRTQVLAALPLGKRQVMSWGHPVTSGLPHVNAFLSADAMEPANGEAHYRETLVRLPGLSVSYARPAIPVGDLPRHDFLCAQSLFKIPPAQDVVFAQILQACPGNALSFFAHPIAEVTAALRDRLRGAGIAEDKIRFIPPCDRTTFLKHLAGAKVVLDTFDWSGGNTSLETLAMAVPIVTLPGRFMRGRHTLAMLRLMGCEELIAANTSNYVSKAVRLIEDPAHRQTVSAEIADKCGVLFDDQAPLDALNRFLDGF